LNTLTQVVERYMVVFASSTPLHPQQHGRDRPRIQLILRADEAIDPEVSNATAAPESAEAVSSAAAHGFIAMN
jgi:hypothetical protein